MKLFYHNQVAYENVMRAFERSDRACIVHATGTGKAYIAASVAKHFKNVLFLVPNEYIQYHTERLVPKSVIFSFYHSTLSKEFIMPHNLDLIVLDEFHRAGATKWGEKVKEIIANNPNAKIFGTTATEIRYLDNGRDMARELFDGNVVSRITLRDAWENNILPIPIYVTGLCDINPACDDFSSRVRNNSRLDEKRRDEALKRVNSLRVDWLNADGISEIIQKHVPKEAKRVIVFCDKIKNIPEFEAKCRKWFSDAGIPVVETFTANNENPNSLDDVKAFTDSFNGNGVKVMFAVNMLNEGIHVDGVDVVVLLRSTMSRIIHLQQIGRCFAADKMLQPVVLDLVDNLNASSVFDMDFKVREVSTGTRGETITKTDIENFVVYDYVKPIRDVMEELSRDYRTARTFDEIVLDLKSFVNEYHRRPCQRHGVRGREHQLAIFVNNHKDHPHVKELLKDYPTKEDILEQRILNVCKLMDEKKRCPNSSEREEYNTYKTHKDDPRIHERWLKYSMSSPLYKKKSPRKKKKPLMSIVERKKTRLEERKMQLFEHIERTGEWPKSTNCSTEEASLYTYWTRHDDEEVHELREKLANRIPSKDENMTRFETWVRTNGKRPQSGIKASEEEKWASQYYLRNKKKAWIADLFKELGIKTYKEEHPEPTREDVVRAIEETGSKVKAAKLLRIGDLKLNNILNAV